MADFNESYEVLKRWEGGYAKWKIFDIVEAETKSSHKNDKGGETMFEIARNNHRYLSIKDLETVLSSNNGFTDGVKKFYKTDFWNKFRGDEIHNQAFASNLFLLSVNAGVKRAIKVGQEACGSIAVDGIYGKQSRNSFRAATAKHVTNFTKIEIRFYESLVVKNPSYRSFLKGWTDRTNAV